MTAEPLRIIAAQEIVICFVASLMCPLAMILQDISFPSPKENIYYDEFLLAQADSGQGKEVLRLWESPDLFVVLGKTGKLEDEVRVDLLNRDKVPVLRRFSGGGTVLQGKGCLNYALIISKELRPELNDLRRSYRIILENVLSAVAELGIQAKFQPLSDLALCANEKKFSGNAQHRGKKFILQHGTILYGFDLSLMERYLKMPKEFPEYRRARPHQEFVANLGISSDRIKRSLAKAFQADESPSFDRQEEGQTWRDWLEAKPSIALFP